MKPSKLSAISGGIIHPLEWFCSEGSLGDAYV